MEALRENFVTDVGGPQWDTLDTFMAQMNSSDSSTTSSSSSSSTVGYGEVLQRVLGSPEGAALRRIFADLDIKDILRGLAGRRGLLLRCSEGHNEINCHTSK